MKKIKFKKIVSLGYNCEVSTRIQEYMNGHFDSYPFSWVFIGSIPKFVNALNNLDDILANEIVLLPSGMVKDTTYEISFHLKEPANSYHSEEEKYKVQIEELKSRFKHLVDKFKNLLNANFYTLFVLKYNKCANLEDYKNVIHFFEENYKSGKFKILFVFEKEIQKEYFEYFKTNQHVILYTIKEFAGHTDTKYGGDIQGWYSSFAYATNNQKFRKDKLRPIITFLKENGFKAFIKRVFARRKIKDK